MIEGQEGVTWPHWCALADACEEHGIDTLFRSDHYISQGDEDANVAHDAWTTIAALAARTTTLRFGTLVSPATFRAPALLANAAATADHVSGGRIELGLGAGWMEREHRAFGFPFPETAARMEMFGEQLEIVHRLWTDEHVYFHGHHYSLDQRARPAEAGAAPTRRSSSAAAAHAARPSPRRASPTSTTRRSRRRRSLRPSGRASRTPASETAATRRRCGSPS